MSNAPLVFITGATGHIGFATLAQLLKKGYKVRVSSRKLASAQKLKDLPPIKPYVDQVSFVEIPDASADGAYDKAVADVDYILHLASPIPDETHIGTDFDVQELYINPAIQADIGMLKSAQKSSTVKRLVITSSVVILDNTQNGKLTGPDDLAPIPKVEEVPKNPWVAYGASKILANVAVEDFVKDNKLNFDIVNILPSYVQGRNEPVSSSKELLERPSSNLTMIRFITGYKDTNPRPNDFVHVDDVAAVHVAAMEAKNITSGERFIAAYTPCVTWGEVETVVRNMFPEDIKNGVLPMGGEIVDSYWGLESSKTTEKLGVKFRGIEDMVRSLVGQYVELARKERGL